MSEVHTKEQEWLQRVVGDWTFVMEAEGAPGEPPIQDSGKETVRSLDEVWIMCENRGPMPDGREVTNIMTIGYDPAKGRFVGTFISSMMTHMWVYEGELDAAGETLTLDTEGPSYTEEGTMAPYRDTIAFRPDGHREHTSSYQREDGSWHKFMTTVYRRAT